MKKIIVRSKAGVFIGEADEAVYLEELKSNYVTLYNSMNINYYDGCASLHQLASGTYKKIRLSPLVDKIVIKGTYFEILEVQETAKVYNEKTNWFFD